MVITYLSLLMKLQNFSWQNITNTWTSSLSSIMFSIMSLVLSSSPGSNQTRSPLLNSAMVIDIWLQWHQPDIEIRVEFEIISNSVWFSPRLEKWFRKSFVVLKNSHSFMIILVNDVIIYLLKMKCNFILIQKINLTTNNLFPNRIKIFLKKIESTMKMTKNWDLSLFVSHWCQLWDWVLWIIEWLAEHFTNQGDSILYYPSLPLP